MDRLNYTQRMQFLEASVRGVYISIACDVERIMEDMIAQIEIDNPKDRLSFKMRKICGLEMGMKLQRLDDGLKAYNARYYKYYKNELNIIRELVGYRNLLAHGYSDYDDNKVDKRFITFTNIYRNKKDVVKIEVEPFLFQMEKYREGLKKLMTLTITLYNERAGNME